jgi:hypothetical protein
MSKNAVHLCDFRSLPEDKECLEAIWSGGRSCKKCYREDCYRQGWEQSKVTFDNWERVANKQFGEQG